MQTRLARAGGLSCCYAYWMTDTVVFTSVEHVGNNGSSWGGIALRFNFPAFNGSARLMDLFINTNDMDDDTLFQVEHNGVVRGDLLITVGAGLVGDFFDRVNSSSFVQGEHFQFKIDCSASGFGTIQPRCSSVIYAQ